MKLIDAENFRDGLRAVRERGDKFRDIHCAATTETDDAIERFAARNSKAFLEHADGRLGIDVRIDARANSRRFNLGKHVAARIYHGRACHDEHVAKLQFSQVGHEVGDAAVAKKNPAGLQQRDRAQG